MSVKKNKKQKILLISVIVAFLLAVSAYFAYDWWESGSFKRAYEHGTTIEQLHVLMTSTRYTQDVRNGGYLVDSYYLTRDGQISWLTTNGEPPMKIQAPSSTTSLMVIFDERVGEQLAEVYLILDEKLNVKYQSFEGSGGKILSSSSEKQKELLNKVREEVKKIPRDVYEAKYGTK